MGKQAKLADSGRALAASQRTRDDHQIVVAVVLPGPEDSLEPVGALADPCPLARIFPRVDVEL